MSGAWRSSLDEIDLWAIDWARQRRIMLGITPGRLIKPQERLGKIRCSLAELDRERDGAGRNGFRCTDTGHVAQDWPEVYTGMSLVIHRIHSLMPGTMKQTMNLHFVWWETPPRIKAKFLDVSLSLYWLRVADVKGHLRLEVASLG